MPLDLNAECKRTRKLSYQPSVITLHSTTASAT